MRVSVSRPPHAGQLGPAGHRSRVVDLQGRVPMAVSTVTPSGGSATAARGRCGGPLGERRGLALRRAARKIQFLLQAVVLPLQTFTLLAFPIPLAFRALDTVAPLAIGTTRLAGALGHATVMADSRALYKYEILDYRSEPANQLQSSLAPANRHRTTMASLFVKPSVLAIRSRSSSENRFSLGRTGDHQGPYHPPRWDRAAGRFWAGGRIPT